MNYIDTLLNNPGPTLILAASAVVFVFGAWHTARCVRKVRETPQTAKGYLEREDAKRHLRRTHFSMARADVMRFV